MNASLPQQELDGTDPYQVYIHLMLVISCDSCDQVFDVEPPFGEGDDYSWDWYRIAADQTRSSGWWISPFTAEGSHPMRCICPQCYKEAAIKDHQAEHLLSPE